MATPTDKPKPELEPWAYLRRKYGTATSMPASPEPTGTTREELAVIVAEEMEREPSSPSATPRPSSPSASDSPG
jgi:hypothetical protein